MDGFDISRSGPSKKATPDNRRHRENRSLVSGLWRALGGDWVAAQLNQHIEKATLEGSTQTDPVAETNLMRKMLSFPEVAEALPPGSIKIRDASGELRSVTFPELRAKLTEPRS